MWIVLRCGRETADGSCCSHSSTCIATLGIFNDADIHMQEYTARTFYRVMNPIPHAPEFTVGIETWKSWRMTRS